MQNKIIVMASWHLTPKRSESTLLILANYVLSQRLEGNEVAIHWFLADSMGIEVISNFLKCNQLQIQGTVQVIQLEKEYANSAPNLYEADEWSEFLHENLNSYEQQWLEYLPTHIGHYIKTEHSTTLEVVPPTALDRLPIWFFGITSCTTPAFIEDNDLLDAYTKLLPSAYQSKSAALLAYIFAEDCEQDDGWAYTNEYKVQLICFAKLLHGVVTASGYDFNQFEAREAMYSLKLDPIYVGSLLSESSVKELSDLNEYEENVKELALSSVLLGRMDTLINRLTASHGENFLFAILWWCVRSDYSMTVDEKLDSLLNNFSDDDVGEKLSVYELLCSGWTTEFEVDI
jgi:hypothetical protein